MRNLSRFEQLGKLHSINERSAIASSAVSANPGPIQPAEDSRLVNSKLTARFIYGDERRHVGSVVGTVRPQRQLAPSDAKYGILAHTMGRAI